MFSASLIMTRYKEPNNITHKSLESLSKQKNIKLTILFLDQFENIETKKYCKLNSNKNIYFKYIRIKPKGNSYAKNIGLKLIKTKYVFFFDPDQIANEFWAINLMNAITKFKCAAVCGKTLPIWEKKPLFISKANLIKELYSLKQYNIKYKEEKIFFGGNVLLNNNIFNKIGNFNENLGRQKGTLLSGEDSEISNLIYKNKEKIIYVNKAKIYHMIPKNRITYLWIINRLYYGGITKGIQNRKPKQLSKRNLYDWAFLPFFAIPYMIGRFKIKYSKLFLKINHNFKKIKKIKDLNDIIFNFILYQKFNPQKFILFKKEKLIYIDISKNASTSIKFSLLTLLKSKKIDEIEIHKLYKKNSKNKLNSNEIENYFKFIVIRNPFDRLVSCYVDKILNKKKLNYHYRYYFNLLKPNTSFETFAKKICKIPEFLSERHFSSQHISLYYKNIYLPNYIIKFENLKNDFEFIKKKYKLNSLPHYNNSNKIDYKEYYNEELAKIVYNRYKKDINIFGYEKEYKELIKYCKNKNKL